MKMVTPGWSSRRTMRSAAPAASRSLMALQYGPTSFCICQAKRSSLSLTVAQRENAKRAPTRPAGQPLMVMTRFTQDAMARSSSLEADWASALVRIGMKQIASGIHGGSTSRVRLALPSTGHARWLPMVARSSEPRPVPRRPRVRHRGCRAPRLGKLPPVKFNQSQIVPILILCPVQWRGGWGR